MGQFKPEPKMMTTEPSVELKLKKGGHVKRMAEGGESRAEHKAEMAKMGKIEKELKAHEAKRASKGHAGLKKGGPANKAMGGRMPMAIEKRSAMSARPVGPVIARPSVAAVRPGMTMPPGMVRPGVAPLSAGMAKGGQVDQSRRIGREGLPHATTRDTTGGIVPSKFKRGGHAEVVDRMVVNRAKGGLIKEFENTKVDTVKGHKGGSKTGDIEDSKFKKGGGVRKYASGGLVSSVYHGADTTKVDTFSGHKGGSQTGGVEGPGYKHGGHVAHSHMVSKHHGDHGHKAMGGESHGHKVHKSHAHGGKVHGGKVHHKAKGGACY